MTEDKARFNFTRDSVVIIVVIGLGAWIVAQYGLNRGVPLSFWLASGALAAASFVIHSFLIKANTNRPQIFVASFMGALTGKLFLSAVILLLVGFLDKPNLKFTTVGYLIAYLLFLAAEIKNLLPLIRNSSH